MERYMDAPRTSDYIEPLLWIGGAALLYYLYKKALPNVTAPIVNAAADAWVAMTSGPAIVPTGGIVLPSGQVVPVASVTPHAQNDGSTTVNVGGTTYTILPGTDDDGNWQAVSD